MIKKTSFGTTRMSSSRKGILFGNWASSSPYLCTSLLVLRKHLPAHSPLLSPPNSRKPLKELFLSIRRPFSTTTSTISCLNRSNHWNRFTNFQEESWNTWSPWEPRHSKTNMRLKNTAKCSKVNRTVKLILWVRKIVSLLTNYPNWVQLLISKTSKVLIVIAQEIYTMNWN